MKTFSFWFLTILFIQTQVSGQKPYNLFPNGDVENVMATLFVMENEYRSHIETGETGLPSFWRLSEGAALCKEGYSGGNAISISRQDNEVTATVYSDFWKLADTNMPFGLPLVPEKEITVSFRYRTAGLKGKKAFTALIKAGVLKDLPTRELSLDLPASKEWPNGKSLLKSSCFSIIFKASALSPAILKILSNPKSL